VYTLVKTISPKISFAFCISVYYIVKIINSHRSKVCCAPTAVLCVCVYLQITLRCDICGNGIIRGHSNYSRCALCWKVLWLGYSGRRGRRTFKPTPHQLTPCSWLLCKLRRRSHTFVHKAADNTRTRCTGQTDTYTRAARRGRAGNFSGVHGGRLFSPFTCDYHTSPLKRILMYSRLSWKTVCCSCHKKSGVLNFVEFSCGDFLLPRRKTRKSVWKKD